VRDVEAVDAITVVPTERDPEDTGAIAIIYDLLVATFTSVAEDCIPWLQS